MTREEAIEIINRENDPNNKEVWEVFPEYRKALDMAIKALKQEYCEDTIRRHATITAIKDYFHDEYYQRTSIQDCRDDFIEDVLTKLPSVNPQPKTGHCKDCKWWKDSDGIYRRGVKSESQCPINRREVLEGNGYCYMFEQQESEE